jgi:sugar phosphate isomerase/epimerase
MEIGCNTYSLRGSTRRTAFERLAALELKNVELWAGHAPYEQGASEAQAVAADAAICGLALRVYCVGGLFGLPPRVVRERLARAVDFARALGIDLVTAIVDRAAVPIADGVAQAARVRVGLENHWYTELSRPADYAQALQDTSPAVGVAIDTGHFAYRGCDLARVARALGRRTVHVHLKVVRRPGPLDRAIHRYRRRYQMPPALPGAGDGLDAFADALAAAGYRGLLAIEAEGPSDAPDVL